MTAARLRNRERCAGPMWRPSERWRLGWDGWFESTSLQRKVLNELVPATATSVGTGGRRIRRNRLSAHEPAARVALIPAW